jgi:hypothetical protein
MSKTLKLFFPLHTPPAFVVHIGCEVRQHEVEPSNPVHLQQQLTSGPSWMKITMAARLAAKPAARSAKEPRKLRLERLIFLANFSPNIASF